MSDIMVLTDNDHGINNCVGYSNPLAIYYSVALTKDLHKLC